MYVIDHSLLLYKWHGILSATHQITGIYRISRAAMNHQFPAMFIDQPASIPLAS